MKNKIIYLIIAIVLTTVSCNDWLDVKPKTQVDREAIFSSENGFKDALTGCYMGLKDKNLYGERLTMTTIEHLVSHWNTAANTEEKALNQFDYKNVNAEKSLNDIYNRLYNVISRANDLLSYIDKNSHVFVSEHLRKLIKGEALAIRAFCHLDLLRLYGPVPSRLELATDNKLGYVKVVTTEQLPRHSYQEYIAFLEEDLLQAAILLEEVDPIMEYRYSTTDMGSVYFPMDEFYAYRRFRFNYYAVEAIKARFYLYTQQNQKAYDAAMFVINSGKRELSTSSDIASSYYALPNDQLLALNIYNIADYAHKLFMDGNLTKAEKTVNKDIFANSTFDARKNGLWETKNNNGINVYCLKKYYQTASVSPWFAVTDIEHVPLIRLSEIYLIAMETGTLEQCNMLTEKYYAARNLTQVVYDETNRQKEIIAEYQRDFYAEGQMFFTYKRLASESVLWVSGTMKLENYIVPMPLTDIIYE